ncbi:hypothetical protein NDU88_004665 [Pleurodeles waltl]|uniref:Uncharacterized protein n=1 Tax=Pleurodeles waltl TaxID=8319 RepID=A0AAV7W5W5_PLEWA|nr:hypothetical protein NDU88_004665 [Pleurodeles waltl]
MRIGYETFAKYDISGYQSPIEKNGLAPVQRPAGTGRRAPANKNRDPLTVEFTCCPRPADSTNSTYLLLRGARLTFSESRVFSLRQRASSSAAGPPLRSGGISARDPGHCQHQGQIRGNRGDHSVLPGQVKRWLSSPAVALPRGTALSARRDPRRSSPAAALPSGTALSARRDPRRYILSSRHRTRGSPNQHRHHRLGGPRFTARRDPGLRLEPATHPQRAGEHEEQPQQPENTLLLGGPRIVRDPGRRPRTT